MLEGDESSVHVRGPLKRDLGGGELGKGSCHFTKIPDEPAIEIGKPQETLQVLAGDRCRPLDHSLNLGRVRLNLPLLDKPKKLTDAM